jgi:hypothetical protein
MLSRAFNIVLITVTLPCGIDQPNIQVGRSDGCRCTANTPSSPHHVCAGAEGYVDAILVV